MTARAVQATDLAATLCAALGRANALVLAAGIEDTTAAEAARAAVDDDTMPGAMIADDAFRVPRLYAATELTLDLVGYLTPGEAGWCVRLAPARPGLLRRLLDWLCGRERSAMRADIALDLSDLDTPCRAVLRAEGRQIAVWPPAGEPAAAV